MTVRFGIVGVGSIASLHARAIIETVGADLVACYSRSAESAQTFANEHGCIRTESLDALLSMDDCDAIVITTPSGTHATIGIRAAEHGKHILCEKPLDISLEAIDRLIAAADEHGVILGSIFQSRFGRGARALKHAIDGDRFGRLAQCSAYIPWLRDDAYYASAAWRGTLENDGGALLNQGIHAVDLLLWLAGEVSEVSGFVQTRIHDIEVEDNSAAWLRFASGGLGVIQGSTSCYPGESKRIEIKGEHGSVTLVDDVPVLWEFRSPAPEDEEISRLRAHVATGLGASDPGVLDIEGHRAQYEDFVRVLRFGGQPVITGAEARRSVQLIRAIYDSSASGLPVRL